MPTKLCMQLHNELARGSGQKIFEDNNTIDKANQKHESANEKENVKPDFESNYQKSCNDLLTKVVEKHTILTICDLYT